MPMGAAIADRVRRAGLPAIQCEVLAHDAAGLRLTCREIFGSRHRLPKHPHKFPSEGFSSRQNEIAISDLCRHFEAFSLLSFFGRPPQRVRLRAARQADGTPFGLPSYRPAARDNGIAVFQGGGIAVRLYYNGAMNRNERILQRLKLRDLHCLLTIVQAGSMAKAAPQLDVSQPVLSKTIADLELLLGVRLLDRSPHGVEATVYGRQLIAASHAVFDELRLGVKEIEHFSDPSAGELSVGSNEASTIGIIPATVERLRREHPGVVVQVILTNTPAEQHQALRERRIDFAVGRIPDKPYDDEFETILLFDQQQAVVAGGHNPWVQRSYVELADLVGEPWVLPSIETTSGQLAADVFRLSGLRPPTPAVVTSSFQLNQSLLEQGPFLALMPASILPAFIKYSTLRRVAVSLPHQRAPVGIIKLRNRAPSPMTVKFIETARQVAQILPTLSVDAAGLHDAKPKLQNPKRAAPLKKKRAVTAPQQS